MSRVFRDVAEWAIASSDFAPNDHVLEVGFGPGVGIELLAAAVPDGFVAGVDPSTEMLDQASNRNAAAIKSGRVDLRRGVAEDLPFDDRTFDAALSLNSLPAWTDPVGGLREIRRVLKPRGTITLAFSHLSPQSPEELPGLLRESGFTDIHLETRGRDACAIATG